MRGPLLRAEPGRQELRARGRSLRADSRVRVDHPPTSRASLFTSSRPARPRPALGPLDITVRGGGDTESGVRALGQPLGLTVPGPKQGRLNLS
uniref:Uncharacterized protein n=1 Tax=Rangifer tarandus platyrhynchus TaxID=3082113 RepID=A0ACB0F6P1_RANTA|nr:unnamed protein product [Rangifer tarandus platyrhynchus]